MNELDNLFSNSEVLTEEVVHKYSCLMGSMPSNVASAIKLMRQCVNPLDFSDEDEELDDGYHHVTILYGLHTNDPHEVDEHLGNKRLPISFKIGSLSLFQNEKSDVLKLGIDSPTLHSLNSHLKELPYTSSYPDYKPHVTVAYLKPGIGSKYLDIKNTVQGVRNVITDLVFSTSSSEKHWIPLNSSSVNELLNKSIYYGVDSAYLAEMLMAVSVGTGTSSLGFVRPIYPMKKKQKKLI